MIKINLLPQNTSKGRGARATSAGPAVGHGSLVMAMTIVLVVLFNGVALWAALHSVVAAKDKMDSVKSTQETLSNEISKKMNEAEQVRKFREVVANQMDVLASLDPPGRILWCEKMNMLSNLIPPDVFLAEVLVTEQVEMVETEASKAARLKWEKTEKKVGKEPQPVKRPLISYLIKLSGVALGKDNVEQFNNVMRFHQAMITHAGKDAQGKEHKFMDGFTPNVDLGSIEAAVYEGSPVNQFAFTLRTQTIGAEELKKPATVAAATGGGMRSRRDRMNKELEQ